MELGVLSLDGGGGGEAGPLLDGLSVLEPLGGPRLTPPYRTPEDGVPSGLPEYVVGPCRPRDRDRVVMPDVAWVCGAVALPLSPGDFPDIYNMYCNYRLFAKYCTGLKNCRKPVHLHSSTKNLKKT